MDIEEAIKEMNSLSPSETAIETILSELKVKDDQIEFIKNEYENTIEEKDKIIDLMAEELADWYMDNQTSNKEIDKKYVIDKFTNKVEEDIKE